VNFSRRVELAITTELVRLFTLPEFHCDEKGATWHQNPCKFGECSLSGVNGQVLEGRTYPDASERAWRIQKVIEIHPPEHGIRYARPSLLKHPFGDINSSGFDSASDHRLNIPPGTTTGVEYGCGLRKDTKEFVQGGLQSGILEPSGRVTWRNGIVGRRSAEDWVRSSV
jgi:hypothetical protein